MVRRKFHTTILNIHNSWAAIFGDQVIGLFLYLAAYLELLQDTIDQAQTNPVENNNNHQATVFEQNLFHFMTANGGHFQHLLK